ncbi:Response regulator receiver domain-containing protein [Catalinimonas alkaloidigena]|uniref:Response regulator receiver domain-containing protein n=1 Tax=Catalinimonas alkaloidigena TaxID=1075417 RepID=A0A1G9SZB7_9BACT|nr:response regulator [Catalinimonas alkaloidigena]SDM40803.1 Response regulator receiver domain-containing protein [Catalinimonas alkaloidigena]
MSKVRSILLVDDDTISSMIIVLLMEELNVNVKIYTAANGQEALDFIQNFEGDDQTDKKFPELILLDINMPVMDGFEFLDKLVTLKDLPDFRIIMLTTSNYPLDRERAKKYPISGYVNKPLTEEKMNEILATAW